MDEFLGYLIKKSDLDNNEYFNYRRMPQSDTLPLKRKKSSGTAEKPEYKKIMLPTEDSYVVFDLETTGMNGRINRIIEIGAVKVIKGCVTDTFSELVDPKQCIPSYISQKVHITDSMVSGKREIEEVLPDFIAFVGDLPLAAHNAPFDMSFLLANAERMGIEINNPVIDTLYLSRKFNKECAKHNLGYLADFFGLGLKNAHRACYDAAATQKLYEIIRKKYLD